MTDWDADTERLRANLRRVLTSIRDDAARRVGPSVESARHWQAETMRGLVPSHPLGVGRFRGEQGLEDCEVGIGGRRGVPAGRVADELASFELRHQGVVAALDGLITPGRDLEADEVAAVIDLSAWAHAQWVRIHPFANGNGRTARFWANFIAMRYGLPPFARLRPRPDRDYAAAAVAAMDGDWRPTMRVSVRCTGTPSRNSGRSTAMGRAAVRKCLNPLLIGIPLQHHSACRRRNRVASWRQIGRIRPETELTTGG